MRLHLLKIFETRTIRMFPLSQQKLHFNAEEINMIERNIQARLIFEQNKIMNLYSRIINLVQSPLFQSK